MILMDNVVVSSVQQYTLDKLRISLSNKIDFTTFGKLSFRISTLDETADLTDKFKSIEDSNDYKKGSNIESFDLVLKKNTSIDEGTYKFTLLVKDEICYEDSFKTNYMEDIRVTFDKIELSSIDTLHVVMKPLTEDTLYQTKKMMSKMSFSIIDVNNKHFSSNFETLSKVIDKIDEDYITEFYIKLKEKESVHEGRFTIRLTCPYKSRTFSIVESELTHIDYMTTTPPKIGSSMITTRTSGTYLTIIFSDYIERTMLERGDLKVYTNKGKDITYYFDPTTISATYFTSSNVDYITRVDIRMYTEYYQLEKGSYKVTFEWKQDYYNNILYSMIVNWVVPGIERVSLYNNDLKHIVLDLPDSELKDWLNKESYLVELDGKDITGDTNKNIFDSKLVFTRELTGEVEDLSAHDLVSVQITNRDNISNGTYTFILYHIDDESGERVYDYIANIDIIAEVTPRIEKIYHYDIQTIKVELTKKIPINIINSCILHIQDKYGIHKDYYDSFSSIEDSNIWEPGQTNTNMFDVYINETSTITSGQFDAFLEFRGMNLEKHDLEMSYIERAKGYITNIDQISIDSVKVYFSEAQSRGFLLNLDLVVKNVRTGQSYTERFENWKNVLTNDHPTIETLIIPMDEGDSIPSGKYRFSFVSYINKNEKEFTEIYKCDVDLGHMTKNIPEINSITVQKAENGLTEFQVIFNPYLEKRLFEDAVITIVGDNGCDLSEQLKEKEKWITTTVSKDGLIFYRTINIQVFDKDVKIEKDLYTITFSWDGIVPYMKDLSKKAFSGYVLPRMVDARVTAVNAKSNTGRIYMKFPEELQVSFFEEAMVEVLNEDGDDHTSFFGTIPGSNIISKPTNDANLNILDLRNLSFGAYQIIIYHINEDNIRESDYIGVLNINAAVYPIITLVEPSAINKLKVQLQNPIPKHILESYHFIVEDSKDNRIEDEFETINDSNQRDWDENLEEVDSFTLILKPGYKILQGICLFEMYNGDPRKPEDNPMRLDFFYFENEHMEGINGEIDLIKPVTLSQISIELSSLESRLLFATLSIKVLNSDGEDVSDRFESLSSAMKRIPADEFKDFTLNILKPIPAGEYKIYFYKEFTGVDTEYPLTKGITLPFLSNQYPMIQEVSAAKVGNRLDGKDAIIIMFRSPGLEVKLFENSNFIFRTEGNAEANIAPDKFQDIHKVVYEKETDENGIEYVEYVTLPMLEKYTDKDGIDHPVTIQKDTYIVAFNWSERVANYMKEITRIVRLDYILFPIKEIIQNDLDSVKITFLERLSGSLLKSGKVDVTTIYESENEDGEVISDVSFITQFQKLQKTNEFLDDKMYDSVIVKMGSNEDYEEKAQDILPGRNYRFIISTDQKSTWGGEGLELQYAFSGNIDIDFMINTEVINCDTTVERTLYNTLEFKFTKDQLLTLLNNSDFFLRNTTTKRDYSSVFMSMLAANTYERQGNDDEIVVDTYFGKTKKDIVISKFHFSVETIDSVLSKLEEHMMFPRNTYEMGFLYNGKEYFKNTKYLPFMSGSCPVIQSMTIKDKDTLNIQFSELPDIDALLGSTFDIMTYRGVRKDGTIIGKSFKDSFGAIANSEIFKNEVEEGITLVEEINIPILPNVTLPSGNYLLKWTWSKDSLYPVSTFIYGLNAVAGGIKRIRTYSHDTIEIQFEQELAASYMLAMELNVVNEDGEDVSMLFKTWRDGNIDMKIEETSKTDTYYIQVDEEEIVGPSLYTFTLNEEYTEETEDGDDEDVETTAFIFSMNITYLAYQFPDIERVDNLSTERFIATKITNDNAKDLYGYQVRLLNSETIEDKDILDKDTLPEYLGQMVKLYQKPRIDQLTIKLDDEIEDSLLNALSVYLVNSDGMDVSDYFINPCNVSTFYERDVIYYLVFTLTQFVTGEDLSQYNIEITRPNGEVITDMFDTIKDSNNFDDEESYRTFRLYTDDFVELHDMIDVTYNITDVDDNTVLLLGTPEMILKTVNTTDEIILELETGTTVIPGTYDLRLCYQNEKDMEDAVEITPFAYTGELPFLSNNIGYIERIEASGLYYIDVTFTEDLPTELFEIVGLRVLNEDGEDFSSEFEDISIINNLEDFNFISEFENSYTIRLALESGASLNPGNYTFEFFIEIGVGEDDDSEEDENEDETEDNEEVDEDNSDEYTLWSRSITLPYMVHEIQNSISSITVQAINKLKVSLEHPVDVSLIKKYHFSLLEADLNETLYEDIFKDINESNFFGIFLLPTDQRYILYSYDGNTWKKYDTQQDISIKKVFIDNSNNYFALCGSGKILRIKDFSSYEKAQVFSLGTSKALNDCLIIDNNIIIVGADGIILKGVIENGRITANIVETNATTKTLTAITEITPTQYIAVGYDGTAIMTKDSGNTWTALETGCDVNINSVTYFKNETIITAEPDNTEDDEDGETIGAPEPEPVIEEVIDNSAIILVGTRGLILVSKDIENPSFTKINTEITKSFYGVCYHDDSIIAVGDGGTIGRVTPEDGEYEFNLINSGVTYPLRDVIFTDNRFIACGSNGSWLTSVSGTQWTLNSYVEDLTFRSITYVPSQYGGTKGDYFYVELRDGCELGPVDFYRGSEEANMENPLFVRWDTDSEKEDHLYDIYYKYECVNGAIQLVGTYQFVKEIITEGEGEDVSTYSTFVWKECLSADVPKTGSYYGQIHLETDNDYMLLYTTKDPVDLPYMIDNPGSITGVQILPPDGIDDPMVSVPFIEVSMKDVNENVLYFSSYALESYNSYVPPYFVFRSSKEATIMYDSQYNISGIRIPIKEGYLPLSTRNEGECLFSWKWMALASDSIKLPLHITGMESMISYISTYSTNPGKITFTLKEGLPISFFEDPKTTITIYQLPKSEDEVNTFNYADYFKSVLESTDFSKLTPTEGLYNQFNLDIKEENILPPGNYIIKVYNPNTSFQHPTNLLFFTKKTSFAQEIRSINSLPTIYSVKSEMYAPTVNPIVNGGGTETYSDYGDPTVLSSMTSLTSNWEISGEETLKKHVGDKYTDQDTLDTYYFSFDKINKEYKWKKAIKRPYVAVVFDEMPCYTTFFNTHINKENGFELDEVTIVNESTTTRTSLKDFVIMDHDTWGVNTIISNEIKFITKIYIPLDETKDFLGAKNASIAIKFISSSIYKTLTFDGFSLNPYVHSYGNIDEIIKINTSIKDTKQAAGLIIRFERPQLSTFLRSCIYDIIRQHKDEKGVAIDEDWSGSFDTIEEANKEDLNNNLSLTEIWLPLSKSSMFLEELRSGTYMFTLTGDKPDSDMGSNPDNEEIEEVIMKKKFKTPWLTTKHPNNLTVKLNTKDTTKAPFLQVRFKGTYPALSSCKGFSLTVKKIVKGKDIDYSDCFRTATSKVTWFLDPDVLDPEEPKVKGINIPMKTMRCLPKGKYRFTFHFKDKALLDSIPLKDSKNWTTFTVSKTILTRIGEIKKVTVKKKKMTVEIKPSSAIKTDALLKKSQIGKALKVKKWSGLLKKLGLVMSKGSVKNAKSNFKAKPKVSKKKITYTLKANKKVNPGSWKFSFNYGGRRVIKAKKVDFKGIIYNKIGKASKDKNCWIIIEKHDGVKKSKVYKTYDGAYKRIKKMRKLNKAQSEQYEKCKKCRKKKFFSTTKIRAQLEKYEFPDKKLIKVFIKKLAKTYYKKIVKKTTKCKECEIVKYTPESGTSDNHVQFHCDNYVTTGKPYSWSFRIATMGSKFPSIEAKGDAKKIYFKSITIKGVRLDRGFKASKKGKTTKKYKQYEKQLEKWIKKYKKSVSRCKKCKKYEIARKGGTIIGWGQALFPGTLRTDKKVKKTAKSILRKNLQKFFKKKRTKKVTITKTLPTGEVKKEKKNKNYRIGCKNADFSFVKKNKTYCRIKCAKAKSADKTLKLGSMKGIYVPPSLKLLDTPMRRLVNIETSIEQKKSSKYKKATLEDLYSTETTHILKELDGPRRTNIEVLGQIDDKLKQDTNIIIGKTENRR